ncbi:MAG: hypothetical protein IPM54_27815 [Polyangiaceae bacterium]|nr:hypothetical protein [Polyangiaceae bacterium]
MTPRQAAARKRSRALAVVVYYGLIGVICIAATAQITQQLFYQPKVAAPYASCHEGLSALVSAIERARHAAPGTDGEDPAIERFRTALKPEWTYFDSVADACRGSVKDEGALDAIERLRYAEEHAVRREAGDLAPLRRKVQAIVDTELTQRAAPSRVP